jgi:gliding motility-associated-like protein/uncharacterized repeat protein (TIGR01451 family)
MCSFVNYYKTKRMKIEFNTNRKLNKVFLFAFFGLFFMLLGQQNFAQNKVFSGGEMAINFPIDFATSVIWSTERIATPGFFTWTSGNVSYLGVDDSHHVNGYVKKIGADTFVFPVGTGFDLRTLAISPPTTNTDSYAAAWVVGDPSVTGDPTNGNALHPVNSIDPTLVAVSNVGQWDWLPINGTGNGLTITVSIPAVSGFGFNNAAFLRLVGWDGSKWIPLGTTGATGLTENSTLSGVMKPGIQAVGIGSIDGSVVEKGNVALIKTGVFNDLNGDGFAQAGETISYSFAVTNTGDVPLTNVTIKDPLPGIVVNGTPISLNVGESNKRGFTAVYTITQPDLIKGTVDNQATVFATQPDGIVILDLSDNTNNQGDNPTIVTVTGCVLKVFNGVTPNGDGINDEFSIQGIDCYPENNVRIYNRWGVLVYNKDNYDNKNGAFVGISEGRATVKQSDMLPSGTYFYTIKYKDATSIMQQLAGYLYLNKD